MVLYVNEQEMIERFVDGLRKASDRCVEIIRAPENEKPLLFTEFLHAIKISAGSAHQIAHAHEDPQWLSIRDLLEKVIEAGQEIPTMTDKQNGLWFNIKQSLDHLCVKGQKLFIARPKKRSDVLIELDQRLKNMPEFTGV